MSPSGTGYTLRSSMRAPVASSDASAPRASSRARSRSHSRRQRSATSSMCTSTAATRQPGQPPDLVGDARADRRRDLGEVEAVLDDDVQVDREPAVPVAPISIPASRAVARASSARDAPLRDHADDAVALRGGVSRRSGRSPRARSRSDRARTDCEASSLHAATLDGRTAGRRPALDGLGTLPALRQRVQT